MKKLILFGALTAGLVSFIGSDVVSQGLRQARAKVRAAITEKAPLETRLAEARVRIDRYAEQIIQGEVAAGSLADRIADAEREIRALGTRTEHERAALVAMRDAGHFAPSAASGNGDLVVATRLRPVDDRQLAADHAQAVRMAERYRNHSALLERRQSDLVRMREQFAQTVQALDAARAERMRLSEDARMLASEIESLKARKLAARTREAVCDAGLDDSGFASADKALEDIRKELRKQDKLLDYYEIRREETGIGLGRMATPHDAATAIDEALAAWPGQR